MGVCGVGEDFSGRLDVLTNNAFAFLHSAALEMAVECSLRRKKMREGLLGDHSYDKHVEHGHVRRGRGKASLSHWSRRSDGVLFLQELGKERSW
jgi:hypothetical protein